MQKVTWASVVYSKDLYGIQGKARYAELKSTLTRKYGRPSSYEWVSKLKKFKDAKNEFYYCMKTGGCGSWSSYWTSGFIGSIQLKMIGMKAQRNKGWVRLVYSGPNYGKYLSDLKLNNKKPSGGSEADAL